MVLLKAAGLYGPGCPGGLSELNLILSPRGGRGDRQRPDGESERDRSGLPLNGACLDWETNTMSWEKAVLKAVRTKADAIPLRQFCREVERCKKMTPSHMKRSNGALNYERGVRATLARLKNEGFIRRVGRGVYVSTG